MLELLLRKLCTGYKKLRGSPSVPFPAVWRCAGDFLHPPHLFRIAAFSCDSSLLFAVMESAKCNLQVGSLSIKILRTQVSTQYPPCLVFLPTRTVISGCRLVFSVSLTRIQQIARGFLLWDS